MGDDKNVPLGDAQDRKIPSCASRVSAGGDDGTFSASLNLLDLASYNPPFVAANGGTAASAAMALIVGIETGQAYFNIHTTVNTGGEIRGQLAPVPLPPALPLFATGLGALGLLAWRRKRKADAA
jgi:CHRD domain